MPEFILETAKGFESFKNCVVISQNEAEGTFTLKNDKTTLTVTKDRFSEIIEPERFEKKYDSNTKLYDKMLKSQYKDYFEERDHTAHNFIHNFEVHCRKEAKNPGDALKVAKELIRVMPKDEKKKVQKLLETLSKNRTINEFLVDKYHQSIEKFPLNEDWMKLAYPKETVVRPSYDTISANGHYVDKDLNLITEGKDYNLKIGDFLENVVLNVANAVGKGQTAVNYSKLKVISSSKQDNVITLMDDNKSFITLPRDTVLQNHKKQQEKVIKQENKQNHKKAISFSYSH